VLCGIIAPCSLAGGDGGGTRSLAGGDGGGTRSLAGGGHGGGGGAVVEISEAAADTAEDAAELACKHRNSGDSALTTNLGKPTEAKSGCFAFFTIARTMVHVEAGAQEQMQEKRCKFGPKNITRPKNLCIMND